LEVLLYADRAIPSRSSRSDRRDRGGDPAAGVLSAEAENLLGTD
jgi:hypothetical protein